MEKTKYLDCVDFKNNYTLYDRISRLFTYIIFEAFTGTLDIDPYEDYPFHISCTFIPKIMEFATSVTLFNEEIFDSINVGPDIAEYYSYKNIILLDIQKKLIPKVRIEILHKFELADYEIEIFDLQDSINIEIDDSVVNGSVPITFKFKIKRRDKKR